MASQPPLDRRTKKLVVLVYDHAKGQRRINNSSDARQFLNASEVFCKLNTPVKYVEIIISKSDGIAALESSVRASLDPKFVTTATLPFLKSLSDPSVEALNDGSFLKQILLGVLVPRTFWTALLNAHHCGMLDDASTHVFAWLCLRIVAIRDASLVEHSSDVNEIMKGKSLLESPSHEVRKIAYRVKKLLQVFTPVSIGGVANGPGGRHDNDFEDFREISIYPTTDELISSEKPFLLRLDDVFDMPMDKRPQVYRDWLYRLLREDMLAELREDLQLAMGQKRGKKKPTPLGDLRHFTRENEEDFKIEPLTLYMTCGTGIFPAKTLSRKTRKEFCDRNRTSFYRQPIGALCCGTDVVAFGSLVREEKQLLLSSPVIGIKFKELQGMMKALKALLSPQREHLQFFAVDTAMFAYEPILQRLKDMGDFSLETQLVDPKEAEAKHDLPTKLESFIQDLERDFKKGKQASIPSWICPKKDISLSGAQLESLIHGLRGDVALIQGPPGTGKSFIGALIVLILLKLTSYRVMVLAYTNHATDQFAEDLIDIGVSTDDIVRLGSKFSKATESTLLKNQVRNGQFRLTFEERNIIDHLKTVAKEVEEQLREIGAKLARGVQAGEILEYLEFEENDSFFWLAFQVPDTQDGFQTMGAGNRLLQPEELFNDWLYCRYSRGIGAFIQSMDSTSRTIWQIPAQERANLVMKWSQAVREEQLEDFVRLSERAHELDKQISSIFAERDRRVLRSKRIIACTTTAAAMNQSIISAANPDIILVEEAGEILEAHAITAMGSSVKQVKLIGDHMQLRPKVNNFKLTKEKGEGFDLNVSLFERLVLQGHPFTTLREQHRSHPDISKFIRMISYEGLEDAPKTLDRKPIRGLRSRVTFVHHEHQEEGNEKGEDWSLAVKASKKNNHEAQMVLKLVKYLGQQGYTSDQIVVLTPYLGQLFLLKELLAKDNDPWLNDLDSHDLIRAGLMSVAEGKVNKTPLRLSTIDNYQGEESDIVIVSLTRSNADGDIGFLRARERLVVLMSRARNGMVLFGNMLTFMKSRKGGEMWKEYFDLLRTNDCLFEGVPVRCERHPEKLPQLLKSPGDFDKYCPDGGCAEPCGAMLKCGKHTCTRYCHRVADHSQVLCPQLLQTQCQRGHKRKVRCGNPTTACRECDREDKETRRRALRDLEMEQNRQNKQDQYRKDLQEIKDEIAHEQRAIKYEAEEKEQAETLKRKTEHLSSLRDTAARKKKAKDEQAERKKGQSLSARVPRRVLSNSQASAEWETMKKTEGYRDEALDSLMGMIGLESVKGYFLTMKGGIDTKIRQGLSLEKERYNCSLLGNPGTGKTTVARMYGKFLTTVGAIPGSVFKETTGSKMASNGVRGCESMLEDIKNEGGGVVFIDEAYQLSSGNNPGGTAVLDYILAEVENLQGKVVFVLAGYSKQMESFFSHNPGFPSRFPITMKFEDYKDEELHKILQQKIETKYNGRMKVEGEPEGLFCRIASRRIGSTRGKEGFGNARAVENFVQSLTNRQAERLRLSRLAGQSPDDLLLTKEDIIGPEPSGALTKSKAYQALHKLIGLQEVKDILKVLLDTVKTNYERELAEEPLIEFSLNRVFLGSPGTGKTTVANLFGRILVDLGLLSNGEVVVKNPADFVGSALGQSEAQTKGILDATVGKVLVIDEAYGLYGGNDSTADPYKTAVIDTIVAEVQSVPGEDRCVLLLGYQDQMEKMFQNVNPGLSRRFPLSSAFVFHDFNDEDLAKILKRKLEASGFRATEGAEKVALEVLQRARNRPNFGNAGEIDILLGRAKESHQKRRSRGETKRPSTLEAVDFDPDYTRAEIGTDIQQLFKGEVGRDKLIALLEGYQTRVKNAKRIGIAPDIPFNFLFRGPPGTGKTTTARKMGKVYYDMGFLASNDLIECSATDIIGSYVGQTGPKVQQMFEKALGRILFIDEAYRLNGGQFAKEAVDEIVDCVTKPKYHGKLIIILAGYDKDINSLLSINPGMSSRFPEVVDFAPLSPDDCVRLMTETLKEKKRQVEAPGKMKFDMGCIDPPSDSLRVIIRKSFEILLSQDGWANARDVIQLAKTIFNDVDLSSDAVGLSESGIKEAMARMINERKDRMANTKEKTALDRALQLADVGPCSLPPSMRTTISTEVKQEEENNEDESSEGPDGKGNSSHRLAVRDAGVSDAVWEQLQRDKEREEQEEAEYHKLLEAQKNAREEDRERIVREVLAEEARRKAIEEKKARLAKAGVCPMGFAWIQQEGGYRCAGGSHWMSDSEVAKL